MKKVITYGTFDLFHIGHVRLLERLSKLGDELIVGISTDEFNKQKGKHCLIPYEQRAEILLATKYVNHVFPENSWDQKETDIERFGADVFAMGSDWEGEFDHLSKLCEVTYLPRTEGVSTTELKQLLTMFDQGKIKQLKKALDLLNDIARDLR